MRNARAFMNSVIALCGPVFKHESFKEEKEWRLVVQCKARKSPKPHFRAAQSTLIFKLDLSAGHRDNYVTKTRVGPSPSNHLGATGVKKLLDQRDLSTAMVENSKLPYRSW